MPADIFARLYDEELSFYFRRPVWSLGEPVFASSTRTKVTPTNLGFKRQTLAKAPASITLAGVYAPVHKAVIRENRPNIYSAWNERLPALVRGPLIYNGWDEFLEMEGQVKTFWWGGINFGEYFVQSITWTPEGQVPDDYNGVEFDQSDGVYPMSINFTMRLEGQTADAGRPVGTE